MGAAPKQAANPAPSGKSEASSRQSNAQPNPLTLVPFNQGKHDKENARSANNRPSEKPQQQTGQDTIKPTDWIAAGASVVSAFVALVVAGFSIWQIIIYRRQTQIMRRTFGATALAAKAAQRSAKAAERAIAGADAQLLHARVSSERELRAYVFATRSNWIEGPEGTFSTTVHMENGGTTPAYDVRTRTKMSWNHFPDPDLPIPEFEGRGTVESWGPRMVRHLNDSIVLDSTQRAALLAGQGALYVYGEARYRDAFGKDRFTRFRMFTRAINGTLEEGLMGHHEGNAAD